MPRTGKFVLACSSVFWAVCAAQTANLTGDWHLNVEKSKWGSAVKPHSVTLTIDHKEPVIQYHGTVTYANEDGRDFGFLGSVDGKPSAMTRSFGKGEITMRRIDALTIESVFRTEDGSGIETARTSVSRDGKTMTRRLRLQTPEGVKTWTEIYDKR